VRRRLSASELLLYCTQVVYDLSFEGLTVEFHLFESGVIPALMYTLHSEMECCILLDEDSLF